MFSFPLKYIATLREQLEQLAEERTADELPRLVWFLNLFICLWSFLGFVNFDSFFFDRVSKAVLNEYSEKIEAIASKLVNSLVS